MKRRTFMTTTLPTSIAFAVGDREYLSQLNLSWNVSGRTWDCEWH